MSIPLYQRDYPNGSKVTSMPCATCGEPKAIGGLYEAECPDCRIKRNLAALARQCEVAMRDLAAAVRDGRGLPVERCESCGALVPAGGLFDVFGVGRCCRRGAGLDGIAPAAGWGHPDGSFDFADVDFDGDRWLLDRGIA